MPGLSLPQKKSVLLSAAERMKTDLLLARASLIRICVERPPFHFYSTMAGLTLALIGACTWQVEQDQLSVG